MLAILLQKNKSVKLNSKRTFIVIGNTNLSPVKMRPKFQWNFTEIQWNFTEILKFRWIPPKIIKFRWNFAEISLKNMWNISENDNWRYFSVKFRWISQVDNNCIFLLKIKWCQSYDHTVSLFGICYRCMLYNNCYQNNNN